MRLFSPSALATIILSISVSNTLAQASLFTADLLKSRYFTQTSSATGAADPTDPFEFSMRFAVDIPDPDFPPTVSLKPNGKSALDLPYDDSEGAFGGAISYQTQAALNAAFPDGTMTVTITSIFTGQEKTQIPFGAAPWPPIPHISNWQALQSIDADPNKPVEVKWDASGGNPLARIQLAVYDSSGGEVFRSPDPTYSDALTFSSQSVSFTYDFAAEQTYFAELTFFNATVLDDSSARPAVLAAYASSTLFVMKTAGTGGGGDAPLLVLTQPANGSTEVDTGTLVLLGFDQPMQTNGAPSIQWSSNVDSNKFSYLWTPGSTNLICAYASPGLPGGQLITWTLNPDPATATLRSITGTALITTNGEFTTKASTQATPPVLGRPSIVGAHLEIPITTEPNREVFLEGTKALGLGEQWIELGSTNFPSGQGTFVLPMQDLISVSDSTFIRAR